VEGQEGREEEGRDLKGGDGLVALRLAGKDEPLHLLHHRLPFSSLKDLNTKNTKIISLRHAQEDGEEPRETFRVGVKLRQKRKPGTPQQK